jgi:hypothetical protein
LTIMSRRDRPQFSLELTCNLLGKR